MSTNVKIPHCWKSHVAAQFTAPNSKKNSKEETFLDTNNIFRKESYSKFLAEVITF